MDGVESFYGDESFEDQLPQDPYREVLAVVHKCAVRVQFIHPVTDPLEGLGINVVGDQNVHIHFPGFTL